MCLEDSHDPEYAQHLADSLDRLKLVQQGGEVVRQDGQQVDDVHEALYELAVVRTGKKSDEKFYSEPGHVDCLQNVDDVVRI